MSDCLPVWPAWVFCCFINSWEKYGLEIGNKDAHIYLSDFEHIGCINNIPVPLSIIMRENDFETIRETREFVEQCRFDLMRGAVNHNLVCRYCEEHDEIGQLFLARKIRYYDVLKLAEECYLYEQKVDQL